jgi:hypothetical protein
MGFSKSAGEPASTVPPKSAGRLDLWIGETGVNLLIELIDDVGGCVLGRARASGDELSQKQFRM